ncbi:MAG: hypothetical protein SGCHY_000173 [Lobulomycetales sp.]
MDLVRHNQKRRIEIECLELQDKLEEDPSMSSEQVEIQVSELRKKLLAEFEATSKPTPMEKIKESDRHEIAIAKSEKNAKFASSFGVSSDYVHGSAFDRELQEQKKQERMLERERREMESLEREERAAKEERKSQRKREKELKRADKAERKERRRNRSDDTDEERRGRSRSPQ